MNRTKTRPHEIPIPVPAGFRFEPMVTSHGWYRLAPFRWNEETSTLERTESVDAKTTIDLEVRFDGQLIFSSKSRLDPWRSLIEARARRMFQLDVDLREFHDLCAGHPTHLRVASSGYGRLLCGSTLFEDAVKIIATTNTTWRQTVRMVSLLVERCGPVSKGGQAGFPTPENIAALSPEVLQQDCRLGYRAAFIHQLASGIVSARIDLATLSDPQQSTEELFRSYRSLPGVGPYGAAHLLAMDGRHDFIAVDTEFRKFVRVRYHGGRTVKDTTMLRRYSKWGRWKYLAYWSELWDSIGGELAE
ncbi:MAG TPA: hypothetical protein VMS12_02205 [Thermoanaerobaculia bacterium]|nr:hypothetical protein [Thermoanaerobaculia bacterium]